MKNMVNSHNKPKVPVFLSWLFPYKRKGLSVSTKSPLTFYLFQNKISLILINWIFQGMRGMGKADLLGKILLEIILLVIFINLFQGSLIYRTFMSLITAHTINWLINAHFWDLGRFIGITRTPPNEFFPYIRRVQKSIETNDSIIAAFVIGGVSRNAGFRETSDVDMIFIRANGFKSTVAAVLVTMRERSKAFWGKFPLHLELYGDLQAIKHRTDEIPIILRDTGEVVKKWYKKKGWKTATLEDFNTLD